MKVEVKVKPGAPFNRKEGGELVTYQPGEKLTVSQHVFERFADRFEVLGDPPDSKRHVRRPPVPGTDDEGPAPPPAGERRIIVTGRPQKRDPVEPADSRPLKTGEADPDPAPPEPATEASPAEDSGSSSSTADDAGTDEARAAPDSTSAAGTPRRASRRRSKKKTGASAEG